MKKVSKKNLKVFGWGIVFILCFLWLKSTAADGAGGLFFFWLPLMIFFAVLTAFDLPLLKTLYHFWMKAAGVISKIVTFLILTILYYFLFTPISILLKSGKNDLLDIGLKKERPTYWIPVTEKSFNKNNYHRQF